MKQLILACVVLGALWSAQPAGATPIFTDSFDYTNGPLVTVSGGTWTTHSGTTGQAQVLAGRVLLAPTNSEDVSVSLGQSYPQTSDLALYASFTINLAGFPSGTNDYFAHFKGSGTSGFRDRIYATTNGVSAGFFRVGVANADSAAGVLIGSDLSLNTDYVLVTRYVISNATSTLWLNPSAETDPAVTATDAASATAENAFALREAANIGHLYFDNLIIGTNFSDVLPHIPPGIVVPPQSQTVMEGGTVTFAVTASGTPPLGYQWQYNGTNLDGATGTLLSLTNVTAAQAGSYVVVVTNATGSTNSQPATLTVTVLPPAAAALSILTYNVHGSAVTNWSTNSPQVQAIGRQMQYLQPDIITFQEIPMSLAYEMTNFAWAYLPGYYLSNSPTADGWTRSSIASRFPIARATSWLRQADLAPYGYTNANFTRDLFEAQITVPGFAQPLHVFTTHLKSGSAADECAKRNAEACAVSNHLVTAFLTANASHPYILTGDLNETDTNQPSIQSLISLPVGLQFTTPINPFTASPLTFSIKAVGGLTKRFDYILPGAMLFTNMTGSQIFRTDLLTNPPPPLLAEDDQTASDHLPVIMYFNNPYSQPFQLLAVGVTNQTVMLVWESAIGRVYQVEASSDLTAWATLASNLTATGTNCAFSTSAADAVSFFRVYRVP